MNRSKLILPRGSVVKKYELKVVILIAVFWTIADFLLFLIRKYSNVLPLKYSDPSINTTKEVLLREVNVLLVSFIIGFFLVSVLRKFLRFASLWINLVAKTVILIVIAMVMNLFIYASYEMLFKHTSFSEVFQKFWNNTSRVEWLLPKMVEWVILFIVTFLALEINEKYSRGVFLDIMLGKYLQPKEEQRIIMFIDLSSSTPIAEKLGHKEYFAFIRDFIFCISAGVMEHDGRIYQYVGDEIVAWWPSSKENARRAVKSLIESRKILNKNTAIFKRRYDILPEYKAGIHTGSIMVGQVGISKKELVMSGDTINTASRIRSACTDLNQKFLLSKEMTELVAMKDWQTESMGAVDLKGKNLDMELFALKI
ncbi:MAG TPA: adenylate/guanylate cyclase domain-containing protein [Chitinophagaceae bacterium]